METTVRLSAEMRTLVEKHLVLFGNAEGNDKLPLRVSGYADAAHLVTDMVKTCILALGEGRNHGMQGIPQPEVNVSGVLSLVLELLPIEEFNLLDKIREAILNPEPPEEEDWDFIFATISLDQPSCLLQ